MPDLSTIEFDLHCQAVLIEGQPVPVYTPVVKVNGRDLFEGKLPYLDTLELLSWCPGKPELCLCTCSCGVPDCAGFFEHVATRIEAGVLTWQIPQEGYRRVVHSSFGPGPWTFHFSKTAFHGAQSRLRERLLVAEREDPQMELSPFDGDSHPQRRLSLTETLKRLSGLA